MTEKNKQFLSDLPNTLEFENAYLVHGSPRDNIWDYIFPDHPNSIFQEFFNEIRKDILIMGHTHVPFVKERKGKLAVNPGSVGQPRDGNPKASLCILDIKTKKAEIKRVEYNIKKTAYKIKKAELLKEL